jgi:hypothetical protein
VAETTGPEIGSPGKAAAAYRTFGRRNSREVIMRREEKLETSF